MPNPLDMTKNQISDKKRKALEKSLADDHIAENKATTGRPDKKPREEKPECKALIWNRSNNC